MRRHLASLAAAALAAVAAWVVIPAAPAEAAVCSGENGVTVLVDFNQLGGGVQGDCISSGGGKSAAALFGSAGFPLTYAQRQPGFVCRVSGVPTSDPCVNTSPSNAYWGLWWSDGDAGSRWSYSSLGATSLKIPNGGLVAFSWDGAAGRATPSARSSRPGATAEPETEPEPEPEPEPTEEPSEPSPTRDPETSAPTPTPTPSEAPSVEPTEPPTATQDAEPKPKPKPDKVKRPDPSTSAAPTPEPSASPSEEFPEVTDPAPPRAAEPADDGLPGWLAPALIVVLFGAAGGVLLLRRRGHGA